MKVAVLGYGVEGSSAVAYWRDLGDQVTVCELSSDVQIPDGLPAQIGSDYLKDLDRFDIIVRSPGIKPRLIFEANPGLDRAKLTSATNRFLTECPAPVIGVTGTKGKGTTSTLIARILEAAGHTVWLGGNIGTPCLDFLPQVKAEDWVVLELSSFQLLDATRSPQVAVMLMVSPDHLEWHRDMPEYATAKQNIFAHQGPGDRAVFNACNLYSFRSGLGAPSDPLPYNDTAGVYVDGDKVRIGETVICSTDEVALPGRHNLDNVCAAVAATWPIVQEVAPVKQAIAAFTGLPMRLEKVREHQGVTYINDSFSTNPETSIAAITTYAAPKVVILGGSDKGSDFKGLAETVQRSNVRTVILIGKMASQIEAALQQVGYSHIIHSSGVMPEVVKRAAQEAQPGDVVLLSPACASFDLFKSYKDRGKQFTEAANSLK